MSKERTCLVITGCVALGWMPFEGRARAVRVELGCVKQDRAALGAFILDP